MSPPGVYARNQLYFIFIIMIFYAAPQRWKGVKKLRFLLYMICCCRHIIIGLIFPQDLQQYPKNGWALYGLAESMRQSGKTQQADEIEKEYKEAWKYSDIPHPVDLFNN